MDAVIEQNGPAINGERGTALFAKAWNGARPRVEAYLNAWRLPKEQREQLLCETMRCFQIRIQNDPDLEPIRTAIEEADKLLSDQRNLFLAELRPALTPDRRAETYRTTMQTSISHLPSFRMIAGWFALVGALFAAFLLTHH